MTSILDIKTDIINFLTKEFNNITFVNEFNEQDIYGINQKPLVCTYLKKLKAKDCALTDLIDYQEKDKSVLFTYGKRTNIEIGFSIFSKNLHSKLSCENIFDMLVSSLLFNKNHNISEIFREDIIFQSNYNLYQLNAYATIETLLTNIKEEPVIDKFLLNIKAQEKGGLL